MRSVRYLVLAAGVAAGLVGGNVTADNIIISDYSHVVISGDGSFTDEGYLAVNSQAASGGTDLKLLERVLDGLQAL